jgi:hypothetical protein
MAQKVLFEDDAESTPLPQLRQDVQTQLLQQMVQWMQAVALAINKERHDEQDHR